MIFYGDKWDSVLEELSSKQGDVRSYDVKFYRNEDGRFNEIIDMWQNAGYDKAGTVEWINYYPGKHFSEQVVKDFEELTGYTCLKAWVSQVRPGRYAPLHVDIDDDAEKYLAKGSLKRWSCTVSKPQKGQVFILENTVVHNNPQGTVLEWPSYMSWHGGGNCSFESKFLFHFLGFSHEISR